MRKIALITTSRAEYGIQSRLIRRLYEDDAFSFFLIVSGTHLSAKHGMTVREIESDGIEIAEKIDLGIDNCLDVDVVMSRALVSFGSVLRRIRPDICILLGDRYEMLAAAMACVLNQVAIAHIHGGETSEGSIDEVFRHSITKAAYLHFTSCEAYRRRVIQLGEAPERVFNVGSLGVENIGHVNFIGKSALAKELKVHFSDRNFLVTFHPVTYEKGSGARQTLELLAALDVLNDATLIFSRPNADSEGDVIADLIESFVSKHTNAYYFKSLGVRRYLSLVRCMDAVIGNSSSGIVEVPSLGVPTINIGNRQKGRIQAQSIINCQPSRKDILSSIQMVLRPGFKQRVVTTVNPYAKDGTIERIVLELKSVDLTDGIQKQFFDLAAIL